MNKDLKDIVIRAAQTWDLSETYDEKQNATLYTMTSQSQIKLILRVKKYLNTLPSRGVPSEPLLMLDRMSFNLTAQYPTDRGEYCQMLGYARIPAHVMYSNMVGATASQYDMYDIYKTVSARRREIERANMQMDYTTTMLYNRMAKDMSK